MLTIDAQGAVTVSEERIRRFLQMHAGSWRMVSTIPGLLMLEREEREREPEAYVLMRGAVRHEGWLVDLVNFIATARLSGDLVIVADGVQREILFERGALKMANSSSKSDLLGEFLVSEGVITREQLDHALGRQGAGKRLGQLLMEDGVLTAPDVYRLLTRKIERIFYDAIATCRGEYYFVTGIDLSRLPAPLHLDTQALLMEGMRLLDEREYYQRTVPRRTAKPLTRELCREMGVVEQRVLSSVNGMRTVAVIGQALGVGMEAANAAVRSLEDHGLIDTMPLDEAEERSLRTIIETFNRAIHDIYSRVEDVIPAGELTSRGQEFVRSGISGNETLHHAVIEEDGTVSAQSLLPVLRASDESDRMKLAIMVLTQYVSFVLFNAEARLPVARQERLSAHVNAVLEHILATHV